MTNTTFNGGGVGLAIIQSANAGDMLVGVKGAMNMTALAVFRYHLVAFRRRQFATESLIEDIRPAGGEA